MISKRAITGLDVTVLVACGSKNKMVTTQALSETTGLSVSNLEQILKQLKDHKIVKSTKGPGGGYQIAAKLEELTVLDLVRIFDKSGSHARLEITRNTTDESEKKGSEKELSGIQPEIDFNPIEMSFIELIEQFLGEQKLIDLITLLPQWSDNAQTATPVGRFKLKEPPQRIIPRSPNSVFQLSAFMGTPAFS
jgi:Rrf2 family iron-sulfur cluster assembly transcriptional regulator